MWGRRASAAASPLLVPHLRHLEPLVLSKQTASGIDSKGGPPPGALRPCRARPRLQTLTARCSAGWASSSRTPRGAPPGASFKWLVERERICLLTDASNSDGRF